MKIVLVLPNVYLNNRLGDHESKEPLGLLYLAAVSRQKGHQVCVIQADYYGLSVEQTVEMILFQKPDLVGYSVTQRSGPSVKASASLLRRRGFTGHLTAGGYLPTLDTEGFLLNLPEFDSIVVGEGELTFVRLVESLEAGRDWQNLPGLACRQGPAVIFNPGRSLICDLDTLPFPCRDLLGEAYGRMGYSTIISSRGCYGNCTFCAQNAFKRKNPGPRWRGRRPECVVEEMLQINRDFGITMFKFNDDDVFGPGQAGRERVAGLCEKILATGKKFNIMAYCRLNDIDKETMRLMRQAGFERLLVGIESTEPRILQEYKKGIKAGDIPEKLGLLKELGFTMVPGFMMFNPFSSLNQLAQDLEFLRQTKAYGVSVSKTLKVHDSTEIKSRLQAAGRLKPAKFAEGYCEYLTDNDVARVYKSLKLIWSHLIDPFQADWQDLVTKLKKSESFNERHEYDEFMRQIWEIQADALSQLILWARRNSVSRQAVSALVKKVQFGLRQTAAYLEKQEPPCDHWIRSYRLYPFERDGECFCLDLADSRLLNIGRTMCRAVRTLVSEQSGASLSAETLAEIDNWRLKENIRTYTPQAKSILPPDQVVDEVISIMNDRKLDEMIEHYYWARTS